MFRTLAAACAAALVLLPGTTAPAQDFPSRPVQLVVASTAGGGFDILARAIHERWAAELGQPVVVDLRPGASGIVGTGLVASSPPDGHTVGLATVAFSTNPHFNKDMPYRTPEDFRPIAMIAATDNVLIAHPASGIATVADLIAKANSGNGVLRYGSSGNGSGGHLAMELLGRMAGINLKAIHYKGGGASSAALISGEVDILITALPTAAPHIQSGMAVAVAVTSSQRSTLFPEVPTVAESGLDGYAVDGWYGVLAPRGVPDQAAEELAQTLKVVMADAAVVERLARVGFRPFYQDGPAFAAYLEADMKKWSDLIAAIDTSGSQ